MIVALLAGARAAAADEAADGDGGVVDLRSLAAAADGSSALPVLLMAVSFALFSVVAFVHVRRIVREVTAVGPFLDLADPQTRMEFTIERGSGTAG
jgi:hypothetical protein